MRLQTPSLCSSYKRLKNYAVSFVLGIILITQTSTTLFYLPSLVPSSFTIWMSTSRPSLYTAQNKMISVCNRNAKERC